MVLFEIGKVSLCLRRSKRKRFGANARMSRCSDVTVAEITCEKGIVMLVDWLTFPSTLMTYSGLQSIGKNSTATIMKNIIVDSTIINNEENAASRCSSTAEPPRRTGQIPAEGSSGWDSL